MKNQFFKTLTSVVLVVVMVAALIPATLLGVLAAETTKTLDLTSANRTSGTSSKAVWSKNGITFTQQGGVVLSDTAAVVSGMSSVTVAVDGAESVSSITFHFADAMEAEDFAMSNMTMANGNDVTVALSNPNSCTLETDMNVMMVLQYTLTGVTATYTAASSNCTCGTMFVPGDDGTVAKDATCKETGWKPGVKCQICGGIVTAGAELPVIDHNYVDGACSMCGEADPNAATPSTPSVVEKEATLTFDANKTGRTEQTNDKQVWVQNGITFTNDKASSTTNVADYSDPVRLYAKSAITIEMASKISKVVFVCGSSTFAKALSTSTYPAGVTATYEDSTVTVTLATPTESLTITLGAQVRVKSFTVTYAEETSGGESGGEVTPPACEHPNKVAIGEYKAPTCKETGMTAGEKCADCQEVLAPQAEIPATGEHNYVEGACSVCGEADPNASETPLGSAELSFADKANRTEFTSGSLQVWAQNGITFTNSGSCADYAAPVRLYKNTTVTIQFAQAISKIEFACNTASYATALAGATITGGTFTANGKIVTLVLDTSATEVTFTLAGGQVRMDSLTLYYTPSAGCTHDNTTNVAEQPATCTEKGYTAGVYCNDCRLFISGHEEIPALGGHTMGADGNCTVCSTKLLYTIPEAIAAADGTNVIVKGTVYLINEAWSSYNNMSVTIKDANGNELYIYRLSTQVAVGDILTITGVMGTYQGARQIAQGATATIDGHEEVEVVYDQVTIPEILTSDDGRLVTFFGTVTNIAGAWNGNNTNVTVTDANGNSIYLYRLATEVALGDIITVKGIVDTYNSNKQVVSATAEITVKAPAALNWSLSLNGDISVNVYFNIASEWLAANTGAQIVFKSGETTLATLPAVAGNNKYTCELAPNMLNAAITCELVLGEAAIDDANVSVADYIAYWTSTERYPEDLGGDKSKLSYLQDVLRALNAYCIAANDYINGTSNLEAQTAPTLSGYVLKNESAANGLVFTNVSVLLHSTVTLQLHYTLPAGKSEADFIFEVEGLNGTYNLADFYKNGHLNLAGINALNLNKDYTVTITDGETISSITVSVLYYIQEALKNEANSTQLNNLLITMYNLYGEASFYNNYLNAPAA